MRRRVLETIADSGELRWLYVLFRTKQEQEELDDLEHQEELEEAQEAYILNYSGQVGGGWL